MKSWIPLTQGLDHWNIVVKCGDNIKIFMTCSTKYVVHIPTIFICYCIGSLKKTAVKVCTPIQMEYNISCV